MNLNNYIVTFNAQNSINTCIHIYVITKIFITKTNNQVVKYSPYCRGDEAHGIKSHF